MVRRAAAVASLALLLLAAPVQAKGSFVVNDWPMSTAGTDYMWTCTFRANMKNVWRKIARIQRQLDRHEPPANCVLQAEPGVDPFGTQESPRPLRAGGGDGRGGQSAV